MTLLYIALALGASGPLLGLVAEILSSMHQNSLVKVKKKPPAPDRNPQ